MKLYIKAIPVELTDEQWDKLTMLSKKLGKSRNEILADAGAQIMQSSLDDFFMAIELVGEDGKQN